MEVIHNDITIKRDFKKKDICRFEIGKLFHIVSDPRYNFFSETFFLLHFHAKKKRDKGSEVLSFFN